MIKKKLFVLLASVLFPFAAHSTDSAHEHDSGSLMKSEASQDVAATEVPPLRIVMPNEGDKVGTQLALVFKTPGDLSRLTMSAPVIGTHLHIAIDDVTLMPSNDQLISLGGDRYLFVFDLPVKAGKHVLTVFWADGHHQTVKSSIRRVNVTAAATIRP